jgi:putative SOS response-associated peptidase YedK
MWQRSNARAETAAEKPAYRSAFRLRRCLVLADGFFEWAKTNGAKQPHYFQLTDGGPFAFAGLWERWAKGEEPIESCTLLTTEANDVGQIISVSSFFGRLLTSPTKLNACSF